MDGGHGRRFYQLTNFYFLDKYNYRAVHFVHKQRGPLELYEKILRCLVHLEQQQYRFVFDRQVLHEKAHQADEALKTALMSKLSLAFKAGASEHGALVSESLEAADSFAFALFANGRPRLLQNIRNAAMLRLRSLASWRDLYRV